MNLDPYDLESSQFKVIEISYQIFPNGDTCDDAGQWKSNRKLLMGYQWAP